MTTKESLFGQSRYKTLPAVIVCSGREMEQLIGSGNWQSFQPNVSVSAIQRFYESSWLPVDRFLTHCDPFHFFDSHKHKKHLYRHLLSFYFPVLNGLFGKYPDNNHHLRYLRSADISFSPKSPPVCCHIVH